MSRMRRAPHGPRVRGRWIAFLALAICMPMPATAGGGLNRTPQPGAGDLEPVRLGMSTALTGPAQSLGQNMKNGVEAAILELNKSGGIKGREVQLIALDDGYEPSRTAPNMRALIEDEHVLGVVGNVGTPTAVAAIPIANELKTPFFGAFTGADVLRKTPPDRYVINYRASYAQETAAMVDGLIEQGGLKPEEIAFFTQRDAYGDAGYAGGIEALKRHGLTDEGAIAHGRYQRNTLAVENGLADIMQADTPCKAVIMVGAYAPCAAFIKLAKEVGLETRFLNVSFVGTNPLAEALGEDGEGVIITEVVPPPGGPGALADAYREAMHAFAPGAALTHGSFEGYIAMRILGEAMSRVEGELTRESIIDASESLGTFELEPGFTLSLGPDDHQASDQIWPTVIRDGLVVPFRWEQLSDRPAVAGVKVDDDG